MSTATADAVALLQPGDLVHIDWTASGYGGSQKRLSIGTVAEVADDLLTLELGNGTPLALSIERIRRVVVARRGPA